MNPQDQQMNNDNSNGSTTSRPAKSVDFERMPLPPAKPADSRTGSDLSRFNTPLRPAGYEQPRPVGKNGRGKTSILEAISTVMFNTKDRSFTSPILT